MILFNVISVLIIIFCLTKLIFNWSIDYDYLNDQIILHYTYKKTRKTFVLIKNYY